MSSLLVWPVWILREPAKNRYTRIETIQQEKRLSWHDLITIISPYYSMLEHSSFTLNLCKMIYGPNNNNFLAVWMSFFTMCNLKLLPVKWHVFGCHYYFVYLCGLFVFICVWVLNNLCIPYLDGYMFFLIDPNHPYPDITMDSVALDLITYSKLFWLFGNLPCMVNNLTCLLLWWWCSLNCRRKGFTHSAMTIINGDHYHTFLSIFVAVV